MLTLFRRWYERHFSQPGTIEFALVLICAFLIVYYLMWLVGPIVVALCIAFCLDWPVQALQKYLHMGRRFASTVVMIIFCSLVIAITVLIVPQIVKQGAEFYNSIISFSLEPNGFSDATKSSLKEQSTTSTVDALSGPQDPTHVRPTYGEYYDQELPSPQAQASALDFAADSEATSVYSSAANQDKVSAWTQPQTPEYDQPQDLTWTRAHNQYEEAKEDAEDEGNAFHTLSQLSQDRTDSQDNALSAADPASAANASTQIIVQAPNSRPLVVHSSAALVDYDFDSETVHAVPVNMEYSALNYDSIPDPAKLINSALPESMRLPDYEDGTTFKLTVSDFDTRLAHEAYLVVLKLPEPIPSMMSIGMIKNAVRQVRIQSTAYLAELMRTQLMPSVVNLFTWAVYLIIVPIFTFLMLYNKEELKQRATLFILPNNQVLMRKFWPSLHQQIAGYIRGKLLHIIIISIANSIAFKLLNVNYALLLGVGVGLSVVIPYVGAVIIAIPVVLVAIFQFGFSESLLWVLVIYTIIQLLDSNVLTPMLFSKAMNLDAFSILAAILIFGGLWGFWGVFFAIPLATFIKTIVMQWPNQDVRDQQKREHLRLVQELKAEKSKAPRI